MGLGAPYISFCYSISEDRDDVEALMARAQAFFLNSQMSVYEPDLDLEQFLDSVLGPARLTWSTTGDGSVVMLDCNSVQFDEQLYAEVWVRNRERFKQSMDAVRPHLATMVEEWSMLSIGNFNNYIVGDGFADFYLASEVFSTKFADFLLVETPLLTRTDMQNGWFFELGKMEGTSSFITQKIAESVAGYIVYAGMSARQSRRNNPTCESAFQGGQLRKPPSE